MKLREEKLNKYIKELEQQGFRIINLERRKPDAIAIKDNKVYAVKMVGKRYKEGKGWSADITKTAYKKRYTMFDGIKSKDFRFDRK